MPNADIFNKIEMSLPDRAIIASVHFASQGFHSFAKIGPAVSSHLKALEDKLSKKLWYDFGLRKLLAVVRMSAAYLESSESKSEDDAVV